MGKTRKILTPPHDLIEQRAARVGHVGKAPRGVPYISLHLLSGTSSGPTTQSSPGLRGSENPGESSTVS